MRSDRVLDKAEQHRTSDLCHRESQGWVEVRSAGGRGGAASAARFTGRGSQEEGSCTKPTGERSEGVGVHPSVEKYLLNISVGPDTF